MDFESIKKILADKTIGIAGCGGLGSNCAVALARSGMGKLIIADFDQIEYSNLNRQYYFYDQVGKPKALTLKENINRINPEVVVEAHELKLNEDNIPQLFSGCDIIVEAFDAADQKQMLIECVSSHFPDKPLIVGSGMAGYGNSNSIASEQYGNIYLCGDKTSEVSNEHPPLAPRVGIVSNMQANTVLELLLQKYE